MATRKQKLDRIIKYGGAVTGLDEDEPLFVQLKILESPETGRKPRKASCFHRKRPSFWVLNTVFLPILGAVLVSSLYLLWSYPEARKLLFLPLLFLPSSILYFSVGLFLLWLMLRLVLMVSQ